jgi:hypothetical protein
LCAEKLDSLIVLAIFMAVKRGRPEIEDNMVLVGGLPFFAILPLFFSPWRCYGLQEPASSGKNGHFFVMDAAH